MTTKSHHSPGALHVDLIKPEHQSGGDFLYCLFAIGFGLLFGTLGILGIAHFFSNKAVTADWGDDLLGGAALALMGLVVLIIGLCLTYRGFKRSDNDEFIAKWGSLMTSVEKTGAPIDGQIQVVKSRSAVRVHSGGPTIDYKVQIMNDDALSELGRIGIELVRAVPIRNQKQKGLQSRLEHWVEGGTKYELRKLFERHRKKENEQQEVYSERQDFFSAPINAKFKTDSLENPHVVIAEADGVRWWCLSYDAACEEEEEVDESNED